MSARSLAVFLAALAVIGLLAYGLITKNSNALAIGDKPPDGALPRLEGGGSGEIADYKGKWVLVNFWASWCTPCRQESPALQSFYNRHRRDNFTVLGIDTRDLSGDGRDFVHSFGVTYPQLRDGDGARAHDFGTTGVPENYLVDPQGRLALIRRGPVDAAYLDRYVAPLLKGNGSR